MDKSNGDESDKSKRKSDEIESQPSKRRIIDSDDTPDTSTDTETLPHSKSMPDHPPNESPDSDDAVVKKRVKMLNHRHKQTSLD